MFLFFLFELTFKANILSIDDNRLFIIFFLHKSRRIIGIYKNGLKIYDRQKIKQKRKRKHFPTTKRKRRTLNMFEQFVFASFNIELDYICVYLDAILVRRKQKLFFKINAKQIRRTFHSWFKTICYLSVRNPLFSQLTVYANSLVFLITVY